MYSKQVYTCPHCLVCVSGECTYTNHVETFVQNISVQNVIKLSSVSMHLISTNITVLQKDIHVKFVKKITLNSLMLINISKLMPLSETHSLVTGVHVNF